MVKIFNSFLVLIFCLNLIFNKNYSFADSYDYNDPRHIWNRLEVFDYENDQSKLLNSFDDEFFFGIASASSHVEDALDDVWLKHAKKNLVPSYHNHYKPDYRLGFFSEPEKEIALASEAGVEVFRMSISWERLMPNRPQKNCLKLNCKFQLDQTALARYIEIIELIRSYGMKVMITIFHHDIPSWLVPKYHPQSREKLGWMDKEASDFFVGYVDQLVSEISLKSKIDYIVTFNEPTLFTFLTHVVNYWPSGKKKADALGLNVLFGLGDYNKVLGIIANTHNRAYEAIKNKNPEIQVGVAHVVPYIDYKPIIQDVIINEVQKYFVVYGFADAVIDNVDFLGINYYGQEKGSMISYSLSENDYSKVSDAGRFINSQGLFKVIDDLHKRYNKEHKDLYYIITENGIADQTDLIRMPFIVDHISELSKAIASGIPIKGYVLWTVSDNWEWNDGYCPKFGIVHVDRKNNFLRYKKPSFYVYKNIIQRRGVSKALKYYAYTAMPKMLSLRKRDSEFASKWDGKRDLCRSDDGFSSLETPKRVKIEIYQDLNNFE